jgi:FKBP-type peptidyl-prolyl cis-trans isomerase FklB
MTRISSPTSIARFVSASFSMRLASIFTPNRIQLSFFLAAWCAASFVSAAGTNEEGLKFLEENKQKEGVFVLPSGLQYKVLTEGEGQFHPKPDTQCLCHYSGTLIDGTKFDSSYDRGEPTSFAPNQVIAGWTEAMQLMVQGDKWELYIPSELGYGDRGSPPKIPGGSVLIFTMEMVEITGPEKNLVFASKRCSVVTRDKCSDKQNAYLDKVANWTSEKRSTEKTRLHRMIMESKPMKPALVWWIRQRFDLLDALDGLEGKAMPRSVQASAVDDPAETAGVAPEKASAAAEL